MGYLFYAACLVGLFVLPVFAVVVLIQDVKGTRRGRLNDGVSAAVVAAWLWTWALGSVSVAAGWGIGWAFVPMFFGWIVGGTCAWRLDPGWQRRSQILGAIFLSLVPLVLFLIVSPMLTRMSLKGRSSQAFLRVVPEAASWREAGARDPEVVARAADALRSPDSLVRYGAADALRRIGSDAERAAGMLAVCLGDKVEDVRFACAGALSSIGPATEPAIRTFLKTADADGAAAARSTLQYMTVPVAEAEQFAELARDRSLSAEVRAVAVFAVSRSSVAIAAVQDEGLHDPAVEVRREAAALHGGSIDAGLVDPDAQVRSHAYWSLAASTPVPVSRLPDLLRGVEDRDETVRLGALEGVGLLESWPPAAVAALIKCLDSGNRGIVMKSISALRSAGPQAAPAVDRLIRFVEDGDPQFEGMIAIDALSRMGPAAARAVPAVRAWTRRNPKFRYFSVNYLVNMGPAGYAAVPDLIEMLEKGDDTQRNAAAHALGEMAPGASAAIPALERARSDQAFGVAYLAGKSLEKIRAAQAGR